MSIVKSKWSLKICFLFIIPILFLGCSKEEFSVTQLPFEELTSSYYVLADNTIEVPDDRYDELVVSKMGDNLVLNNDALFQDLKEGSIIVSQLDVEKERLLFREIVSLNQIGSTIETTTRPANVVKAFKEYYFNSEYSDLIAVRSDYNIESIFKVADNVVNLLASAFIPIPFDPDFIMTGVPQFEAIHPHVAYKYFGCDDPPNCLQNINTTDVNPQNGYYDVVDDFFTDLDRDINKNGLYTFTIKDFGIKELKASVNVGEALTSEYPYGDPQAVFEAYANQAVTDVTSYFPTDLKLKYFPIGSFFGLVNFAAVIGPEFGGLAKKASAYLEVNTSFPNKANLRMGHLNWNNTSSPNFDFDMQLYNINGQDTTVVGLGHLIEGGQVNATMGAKGEVGYKFGIGVGAAVSFGEPNYAGEAVGVLVDVAAYINFKGHVGIVMTDLLTVGAGETAEFGNICMDTGLEFGAKFFFDENVVGTVFDEWFTLDIVIPIPSDYLPLSKFSFLQFLENYTNDGICLGSDACAVTSQTYFNMAIDGNNGLDLEFKHVNDKVSNEMYEVEFVAGSNKYKVDGTYAFDQAVEVNHTTGVLEILEAYDAGNLKINVKLPMLNCSSDFDQSEIGLYFPCVGGFYDLPSGTVPFVQFDDVALTTQYYFLKENAPKHCESIEKKLMSKDEVLNALTDECLNPTGFLIKQESTFIKANSHLIYIWIPETPEGHNILEVTLDPTTTGNKVASSRTLISSKSTYAPCVCAN